MQGVLFMFVSCGHFVSNFVPDLCLRIFWNLFTYYKQFEEQIQQNIAKEKSAIEKEVKVWILTLKLQTFEIIVCLYNVFWLVFRRSLWKWRVGTTATFTLWSKQWWRRTKLCTSFPNSSDLRSLNPCDPSSRKRALTMRRLGPTTHCRHFPHSAQTLSSSTQLSLQAQTLG